jgi:hypothetical protein
VQRFGGYFGLRGHGNSNVLVSETSICNNLRRFAMIFHKPVKIQSAFLFHRISTQPPHQYRQIEAIAVVVQAGFSVKVLCAEAVTKDVGHGAEL